MYLKPVLSFYLFCLLVLAVSGPLAEPVSAEAITGRVVDDDQKPIPNVTLTASQAGVGTIADQDGRFSIDLPDNVEWITFSAIGYRPRQIRLSEIPDPVRLETQYYRGTDITVSAERANPNLNPVAMDHISEEDIKRDYAYGEFPLLLQSTANLHSYSDAGSAFGYSYIRIRGFDDKRISTYINGVPLNDPEDQATYFVDLPDFASTATDIQIQRGVGNSLYGDGSFGGSINIVTNPFSQQRKTMLTAGYGEYRSDNRSPAGIYRQNIEYNSGLIDGQWQYAGRFSKQASDGYRDNSWYIGWSYYFSVARLDPNMTTQFETYGGPMQMHLSYWGVPKDSVATNPQYNPLKYSNETDNFNQPHYQLTNRYRINENATLTNTLYYIRGKGYYEQFKEGADFYEYDLAAAADSMIGNLVRQQWVHKNQIGWNPRVDIKHSNGTHAFGGSFYYFESDHWGQVVWINPDDSTYKIQGVSPRHRYYQYFGTKYVGSVFFSESYSMNERLSGQVTLQLRHQRYQFDQVAMGAFSGLEYDLDWWFFSPRAGLSYQLTDHSRLFGNFSIASRTPTDASIYDANDPYAVPSLDIKSERVYDYELAYEHRGTAHAVSLGLFYMDFYDEIIPFGGISDDGILETVNAKRSIHSGLELSADWKPTSLISFSGNAAYNRNRIKEWGLLLDNYDVDFDSKTIPFFPAYLANLSVDYNQDSYRITFRSHYAGKQYAELLNIESLSLDPYVLFSIDLSYRVNQFLGLGTLTLTGKIENLFDKKYLTSGYGGNFAYEDGSNIIADGWAEYYPGAERSFYGQLKLELF